MPFHTADPVLLVEESRLRNNIDPRDPESLFGMWSVFHKCAGILEHGRRLENLSWRVFAHETLCVSPNLQAQRKTVTFHQDRPHQLRVPSTIPELSSSVESNISVDMDDELISPCDTRGPLSSSIDRSRTIDKHITPVDLQNLVISIKVKQDLTGPLAPLHTLHSVENSQSYTKRQERRNSEAMRKASLSQQSSSVQESVPTPRPSSPRPVESTSTIATDSTSFSLASPSNASETSAGSELAHPVVRGFRAGSQGASTYRSQSSLYLAPPTSQSTMSTKSSEPETTLPRKKGGLFQLGGSLTEDEASVRDHSLPRSQESNRAAPSLNPYHHKKHASFLEKVTEIPKKKFYLSTSAEDGNAIESDDEDAYESEEEVSESAIEDDEDWEDEADSEENSRPLTFPRVESKANLVSHRSIITQGLHETQRAAELQNAASRSTPHMRRSRTSTPNGPSMPASPEEPPLEYGSASSVSQPIVMPFAQLAPAAQPPLSPRATRRNMLTQELGVSLRKHMLNERQQRNVPYSTASAATAFQRRHTSHNIQGLTQYPGPAAPPPPSSKNNSWNESYEYGTGEYHQTGW